MIDILMLTPQWKWPEELVSPVKATRVSIEILYI